MSPLLRLIREVHRRSLWQVLAIYLAASYAVYQVVLNLRDGVGLPDWVPGATVVVLLIGLPIVLATAFVQEGGPSRGGEGEARGGTSGSSPDSSAAALPGASPPSAPSTGVSEPAITKPDVAAIGRVLTWRRVMLTGVVAFVVLGVGTGGYMAMRVLGIGPVGTLIARGVLKKRDPILLADFQSPTGDTLMAAVVGQALRVGLEDSRTVSLVDAARVQQALQRMRLPDSTRLGPGLAREIALREGFKAYIAGEVSRAGGGYLITARLVSTDSDRTLTSFQETAADSTKLLPAVGRLSSRLQERVGESLKSIHAQPPLAQVTTSSMEALRDYTLAREELNRGNFEKGVTLLREAVRQDSTFAMAFRLLSATMSDAGPAGPGQAAVLAAAQAAVRNGDRLDDRERWQADAWLAYITGRYDDARRTYEALQDVYPDDEIGLVDLGWVYVHTGDLAKAEQSFQRALAVGTRFGGTYVALIDVQLARGEAQAARRSLEVLRSKLPGSLWAARGALNFSVATQDNGAISQVLQHVQGPGRRASAFFAALLEGRPSDALQVAIRMASVLEQQGRTGAALGPRLAVALADAVVLRDTIAAARDIEAALSRDSLDSGPAGDRPYLLLAYLDAVVGRTREAAAVLREYDKAVVEDLRRPSAPSESAIQGFIVVGEGRPSAALRLLRQAQRELNCDACYGAEVGRVQELLGRPDSAIAAYENYISNIPLMMLLNPGPPGLLPLAWVQDRLGELYDQRGDTARAVKHYAAFVQMWKNAEPDLQPRVAAARRRLQALLEGKG